jgi:inositol oxygenase
MNKPTGDFRNYAADARPSVREFYRLNHRHQTLDFVLKKKAQYLSRDRRTMGVWDALEYLNTLVDDSDPDLDLTQIDHALQTAESIRQANQPRWFVVTGLIHDLGKILCLWGEPQWAVVGDTFPVGCAFSGKIVYPEFFEDNPDSRNPAYSTELGMYERHCGLEHVHMSWGHDEYLYHVVKDRAPEETLYMIRYHSFYAAHHEGEYGYLMNDRDREMFRWVRAFNRYDLYSKGSKKPDRAALQSYYEDLVAEFFPEPLKF